MSWDQAAYSFGNPNAQPPTPTRTPTSGQFPSPTFETPKNSSSFENRSGWTPTFAEEYSVFDTTPGRLTGHHQSFVDISTPQPSAFGRDKDLTDVGDLTAELATHIPLAPADPSTQPPSSPVQPHSISRRLDDSTKRKVTPRKPRKRLEEAFSGQTATPPQTASKGARKLAPKVSIETMQDDSHDGQYGTPSHHPDLLSFPSTSADLFGYPLSAPASASVFNNTQPFLDGDISMSGMDFDLATEDSNIFGTVSHRISSSLDWGKSNQLFQDNVNGPSEPNKMPQPRRQRPLAPKALTSAMDLPASLAPFDFSTSNSASKISAADDPFSTISLGGVDPGLLFGRHNSATPPAPRPATSHTIPEPYEHQLRESRRDQEELRRSRSTRDSSGGRRFDRKTMSSPVRSSRPILYRSVSDTRGNLDRMPSRAGRSSPLKRQRPGSLSSIAESPVPRPRTEVIFTIDSKGKARTETVIVGGTPKSTRGPPSSSVTENWDSSQSESSSDDEPIILPSRNSSFNLPPQPKGPKLARFETSNQSSNSRRRGTAANGYSRSESSSQHSMHLDGVESEAETVVEEDEGTGDAALELRKVMEGRKKMQFQERNGRHHRYVSGTSSRGSQQYVNYSSSTNLSPTTVTDPDGATPSSSGGGTTRCVCNNPSSSSEGLMIQCESCDYWLHGQCVNIDSRSLPPVYICAFCAQTPNMRGGRIREAARGAGHPATSPLAHKSFKSFR